MGEKFYTVKAIDGEYATLVEEKEGGEVMIAMFLLPDGTDVGSRLLWENFEWTLL